MGCDFDASADQANQPAIGEHGKHAATRRGRAPKATQQRKRGRETLTLAVVLVDFLNERTREALARAEGRGLGWRFAGVGGAEESGSRRDGCSTGLSAARKQAGRRLRGLTQTGEARTARAAVRPGALVVAGARVQHPGADRALERRCWLALAGTGWLWRWLWLWLWRWHWHPRRARLGDPICLRCLRLRGRDGAAEQQSAGQKRGARDGRGQLPLTVYSGQYTDARRTMEARGRCSGRCVCADRTLAVGGGNLWGRSQSTPTTAVARTRTI